MKESCPSCDSQDGIRKILYGEPDSPVDESKFFIGGCCITGNDPIWACVDCGWRGWALNNTNFVKLSEWQCPMCKTIGKLHLIALDNETNNRLRNYTFKFETTYSETSPNCLCLKCGWTATLVRTYSY